MTTTTNQGATMTQKNKPTYEQALALQKAQDASRDAGRRRRNETTQDERTDEQRAKDDAAKAEALAAYRAKKERTGKGWGE